MANPGPASTTGSTLLGRGSPLQVGETTASLVGFYGTAPIAQRSLAAQATSVIGTASSADVTSDLKAAIIEIMNTLAALGVWKGSA